MKVLTAAGGLQRVRSFPMAGLDATQMRSPSAQAIPLGRLPSGETRMLAISRIYRTNPVLYACVHLIARGLSSIPIRTYTYDSEGERRRLRSDVPQPPGRPESGIGLDRLMRKPAPRVSRRRMVFRNTLDTAIFGNAISTYNWGPYGPTELWPIPWRRTVVTQTDPMTISRYDVYGAKGHITLQPERVIHWTWGDDPESPSGVSPIESLSYTIALHNAIDRHLISYYGNAARPSGVLKFEKAPRGDDLAGLREQFKQLYTAPENAGNVVFTSGEFTPIAEETGVPTLVELVKLSAQEIMGVYGVDPPMIGIYAQAIKANFQEAREKHVLDTLGPWATLWADEVNAQMVGENPAWDNHWVQFDMEERLRPDMASLADIMLKLATTWTPNERRRYMHMPQLKNPDGTPMAEADTVWSASGTIPVGMGTPTTVTGDLPETLTPDGTELPDPTLAPPADPGDDDDDEEV